MGSVLVSIWVPKCALGSDPKVGGWPPGRLQDGHVLLLAWLLGRLVLRGRFFHPLGLILGSFWGAPGVVLVPLEVYF